MPQAIAGAQPIKHRERQGRYWVHTTTDGKHNTCLLQNIVVTPWGGLQLQVKMCLLVSNQV